MTQPSASSPTWYGDIKDKFTPADIACMQGVMGPAFNLGSYQFVVEHASQIYQVVASGYMPKGGPAWSTEWVTTFRNWIAAGFPEGTAPARALKTLGAVAATRVRKDIRDLSPTEIATLGKAFQGIMALDASNPNSYFKVAAIHWLPAPDFFCMHHDPAFLSWHRAYQIIFEDALRSIPGCENVTMPYWDITMQEPLPQWLFQPPFASYTFPQDVGPTPYLKGYTTQRNSAAQILNNLGGTGSGAGDVFLDVSRAMAADSWELFNGFFADADYDTLIAGHDNGHNSIGTTMGDQSVAAFDPIFWFFHGNWDRVFEEWQKEKNATDQAGMLNRIAGDQASYDTFTDPIAAQLAPFTSMNPAFNAIGLLDLSALGIQYAPAATQVAAAKTSVAHPAVRARKSVHAAESFTLDPQLAHVRVNGINRIKIPGSFRVDLLRDGKSLGSSSFFQPSNVKQCSNCIKNADAHFDFKLPLTALSGGTLSVSVTLLGPQPGTIIPLAALGNPTIEVRLPLFRA
jgi:tyrosinase